MQNEAKREGMRVRLASTLDGLHRRVLYARAMMTPRTYIANPWFRVAAAAAVGYRLGSPASRLGQPTTVLGALLHTVLVNVATSAMRDAIIVQPSVHGPRPFTWADAPPAGDVAS